jgi:RsiW-degrading membrane proteinase PrsW (M82 family)
MAELVLDRLSRGWALRAPLLLGTLCAVCLLACLGCSAASSPFGHLAGSNDAALEYVVDPDPVTGKTLEPSIVATGVKSRLGAGQIMAEVSATDEGRVRVVVDADVAGTADDLVVWRGGLRALRADDGYVLFPPDTTGVQPMSAAGADGEERWWQGSAEAVGRVVREAKLDAEHIVFAERLPGSTEWRTRVAALPPLVALGIGAAPIQSISPLLHGRALALGFAPDARAAIADDRALHPRARIVLARGRVLVATLPVADALASPLVLRFGDDLPAYTRAAHAKNLLRSPILPPLHRVSAGALPPRWGLSAACALLPFVLSFAWLFFVRRFDRVRPEPVWLVIATFLLGGLAIVPAALAEMGLSMLSPWLDPGLATLGGQVFALPLSIAVFTVAVGAVEETAKYAAAWSLARHRKEFDEPVDGIVYGCAAALGFAAVENIKYFALGRMSGVVIAMRAFETVPAHMFFGAIWGYGMGLKLVSRRARVLPYLAIAALAHGTFDAVVSTEGLQLVVTVLVLVLAFAFVVMLRRSLRHGAVPVRALDEDVPPASELFPLSTLPRVYFRVGSPLAFWSCAAGMISSAFALTVLGTAFELLHHRVGLVFVVLASVMLALFGLAAYGTSATIPLDVAIDARGITFAGGLTPWGLIQAFAVEQSRGGKRAFVKLQTPDGVHRLGPARADVAESIVAAMRGAT